MQQFQKNKKNKKIKTTLKNHISSKMKSRKMGPSSILIKEEEGLIHYLDEMVALVHPPNPSQLKTKSWRNDSIKNDSFYEWYTRQFMAEMV